MTDYVVDASVALKWLVTEDGSDRAAGLLNMRNRLSAPALIYSEVANALRTMQVRNRLLPDEASEAIATLIRAPINTSVSMKELAAAALHMATDLDHPAYDCFYLSLAVREHWQMVTADRQFHGAVAKHPYLARHVVHLDGF